MSPETAWLLSLLGWALAALGWLLVIVCAVRAGQWYRTAESWRMTAERMMQKHTPAEFAVYTDKLAARGDVPLVTKYMKEP